MTHLALWCKVTLDIGPPLLANKQILRKHRGPPCLTRRTLPGLAGTRSDYRALTLFSRLYPYPPCSVLLLPNFEAEPPCCIFITLSLRPHYCSPYFNCAAHLLYPALFPLSYVTTYLLYCSIANFVLHLHSPCYLHPPPHYSRITPYHPSPPPPRQVRAARPRPPPPPGRRRPSPSTAESPQEGPSCGPGPPRAVRDPSASREYRPDLPRRTPPHGLPRVGLTPPHGLPRVGLTRHPDCRG